ncbi:methyltransferase domain-containing protein, partial [Bordetella pertussis]
AHARQAWTPGGVAAWLGRLAQRGKPAVSFVRADLAASGLPPEQLDLVWSNLALHWHPEPHAVLAEWRRILKVGGLAMFSCLGPGTLRELREALADAGLRTATPTFVDMHDFGDLLVENGFADPVMDQETLTLTYETPQRLLEDVRALGGNPARDRRAGLAGRAWLDRLHAALEARRGPQGR